MTHETTNPNSDTLPPQKIREVAIALTGLLPDTIQESAFSRCMDAVERAYSAKMRIDRQLQEDDVYDDIGTYIDLTGVGIDYLNRDEHVYNINGAPIEGEYAGVDFSPEVLGADGGIVTEFQRRHVHNTMVQLQLGLASAIAAIDTGVLPKPNRLLGATNARFAKYVERHFGFTELGCNLMGKHVVSATYDQFHQHAVEYLRSGQVEHTFRRAIAHYQKIGELTLDS